MKREPVLVVMAAGMGSRYGGLKQIDPVGSHGEAILDYSLFDAAAAGFKTAVIIIKEAIREDFMATVGKRLEQCPMEIRYAYQEVTKIPAGFSVVISAYCSDKYSFHAHTGAGNSLIIALAARFEKQFPAGNCFTRRREMVTGQKR